MLLCLLMLIAYCLGDAEATRVTLFEHNHSWPDPGGMLIMWPYWVVDGTARLGLLKGLLLQPRGGIEPL